MRIELSAYRKITPRSELIKCYQQRLEELEQHSYFSPDEEQEKEILKKYGLRRKYEIWKMDSMLKKFLHRAKTIIGEGRLQSETEKGLRGGKG